MSVPPDVDVAQLALDALTDEELERIRVEAWGNGDFVMAMRCEHALVDDLARLDVAMELLRQETTP